MSRKIFWPILNLPPLNLWSMPSLTYIEYRESFHKGKKVYSTVIKDNPLYKLRARG